MEIKKLDIMFAYAARGGHTLDCVLSKITMQLMQYERDRLVLTELLKNHRLPPYHDLVYVCTNCEAMDGASHPKTACCWYCGHDAWETRDEFEKKIRKGENE